MISSLCQIENQYVPGCGHLFSQKAWEDLSRLSKLPETESLQAFLNFAYVHMQTPIYYFHFCYCIVLPPDVF